jgi:hypothetical protein
MLFQSEIQFIHNFKPKISHVPDFCQSYQFVYIFYGYIYMFSRIKYGAGKKK